MGSSSTVDTGAFARLDKASGRSRSERPSTVLGYSHGLNGNVRRSAISFAPAAVSAPTNSTEICMDPMGSCTEVSITIWKAHNTVDYHLIGVLVPR